MDTTTLEQHLDRVYLAFTLAPVTLSPAEGSALADQLLASMDWLLDRRRGWIAIEAPDLIQTLCDAAAPDLHHPLADASLSLLVSLAHALRIVDSELAVLLLPGHSGPHHDAHISLSRTSSAWTTHTSQLPPPPRPEQSQSCSRPQSKTSVSTAGASLQHEHLWAPAECATMLQRTLGLLARCGASLLVRSTCLHAALSILYSVLRCQCSLLEDDVAESVLAAVLYWNPRRGHWPMGLGDAAAPTPTDPWCTANGGSVAALTPPVAYDHVVMLAVSLKERYGWPLLVPDALMAGPSVLVDHFTATAMASGDIEGLLYVLGWDASVQAAALQRLVLATESVTRGRRSRAASAVAVDASDPPSVNGGFNGDSSDRGIKGPLIWTHPRIIAWLAVVGVGSSVLHSLPLVAGSREGGAADPYARVVDLAGRLFASVPHLPLPQTTKQAIVDTAVRAALPPVYLVPLLELLVTPSPAAASPREAGVASYIAFTALLHPHHEIRRKAAASILTLSARQHQARDAPIPATTTTTNDNNDNKQGEMTIDEQDVLALSQAFYSIDAPSSMSAATAVPIDWSAVPDARQHVQSLLANLGNAAQTPANLAMLAFFARSKSYAAQMAPRLPELIDLLLAATELAAQARLLETIVHVVTATRSTEKWAGTVRTHVLLNPALLDFLALILTAGNSTRAAPGIGPAVSQLPHIPALAARLFDRQTPLPAPTDMEAWSGSCDPLAWGVGGASIAAPLARQWSEKYFTTHGLAELGIAVPPTSHADWRHAFHAFRQLSVHPLTLPYAVDAVCREPDGIARILQIPPAGDEDAECATALWRWLSRIDDPASVGLRTQWIVQCIHDAVAPIVNGSAGPDIALVARQELVAAATAALSTHSWPEPLPEEQSGVLQVLHANTAIDLVGTIECLLGNPDRPDWLVTDCVDLLAAATRDAVPSRAVRLAGFYLLTCSVMPDNTSTAQSRAQQQQSPWLDSTTSSLQWVVRSCAEFPDIGWPLMAHLARSHDMIPELRAAAPNHDPVTLAMNVLSASLPDLPSHVRSRGDWEPTASDVYGTDLDAMLAWLFLDAVAAWQPEPLAAKIAQWGPPDGFAAAAQTPLLLADDLPVAAAVLRVVARVCVHTPAPGLSVSCPPALVKATLVSAMAAHETATKSPMPGNDDTGATAADMMVDAAVIVRYALAAGAAAVLDLTDPIDLYLDTSPLTVQVAALVHVIFETAPLGHSPWIWVLPLARCERWIAALPELLSQTELEEWPVLIMLLAESCAVVCDARDVDQTDLALDCTVALESLPPLVAAQLQSAPSQQQSSNMHDLLCITLARLHVTAPYDGAIVTDRLLLRNDAPGPVRLPSLAVVALLARIGESAPGLLCHQRISDWFLLAAAVFESSDPKSQIDMDLAVSTLQLVPIAIPTNRHAQQLGAELAVAALKHVLGFARPAATNQAPTGAAVRGIARTIASTFTHLVQFPSIRQHVGAARPGVGNPILALVRAIDQLMGTTPPAKGRLAAEILDVLLEVLIAWTYHAEAQRKLSGLLAVLVDCTTGQRKVKIQPSGRLRLYMLLRNAAMARESKLRLRDPDLFPRLIGSLAPETDDCATLWAWLQLVHVLTHAHHSSSDVEQTRDRLATAFAAIEARLAGVQGGGAAAQGRSVVDDSQVLEGFGVSAADVRVLLARVAQIS
ncbi:hypothetical protein BC828DRAFT_372409 [Blastocladiella britannica]|nr:hypothetical protein BC828DRAFT_372409 [Blastocladiella britannica]